MKELHKNHQGRHVQVGILLSLTFGLCAIVSVSQADAAPLFGAVANSNARTVSARPDPLTRNELDVVFDNRDLSSISLPSATTAVVKNTKKSKKVKKPKQNRVRVCKKKGCKWVDIVDYPFRLVASPNGPRVSQSSYPGFTMKTLDSINWVSDMEQTLHWDFDHSFLDQHVCQHPSAASSQPHITMDIQLAPFDPYKPLELLLTKIPVEAKQTQIKIRSEIPAGWYRIHITFWDQACQDEIRPALTEKPDEPKGFADPSQPAPTTGRVFKKNPNSAYSTGPRRVGLWRGMDAIEVVNLTPSDSRWTEYYSMDGHDGTKELGLQSEARPVLSSRERLSALFSVSRWKDDADPKDQKQFAEQQTIAKKQRIEDNKAWMDFRWPKDVLSRQVLTRPTGRWVAPPIARQPFLGRSSQIKVKNILGEFESGENQGVVVPSPTSSTSTTLPPAPSTVAADMTANLDEEYEGGLMADIVEEEEPNQDYDTANANQIEQEFSEIRPRMEIVVKQGRYVVSKNTALGWVSGSPRTISWTATPNMLHDNVQLLVEVIRATTTENRNTAQGVVRGQDDQSLQDFKSRSRSEREEEKDAGNGHAQLMSEPQIALLSDHVPCSWESIVVRMPTWIPTAVTGYQIRIRGIGQSGAAWVDVSDVFAVEARQEVVFKAMSSN